MGHEENLTQQTRRSWSAVLIWKVLASIMARDTRGRTHRKAVPFVFTLRLFSVQLHSP